MQTRVALIYICTQLRASQALNARRTEVEVLYLLLVTVPYATAPTDNRCNGSMHSMSSNYVS